MYHKISPCFARLCAAKKLISKDAFENSCKGTTDVLPITTSLFATISPTAPLIYGNILGIKRRLSCLVGQHASGILGIVRDGSKVSGIVTQKSVVKVKKYQAALVLELVWS